MQFQSAFLLSQRGKKALYAETDAMLKDSGSLSSMTAVPNLWLGRKRPDDMLSGLGELVDRDLKL